jgi:beta-lactamase regulating signal transducer with metallopeptidase domain
MTAMLAATFVKVTILLLCAAGVTVLLQRSTAAMRHLVWALGCAGVLALPAASAIMPDWSVRQWPSLDVPVAFDAEPVAVSDAQASSAERSPAAAAAPLPSASSTTVDQQPLRWRLTPDWPALILPLWLAGAALILAGLGLGLARIAWLGRTATPVRDASWLALTAELAGRLGITRPIRVLRASGPAMPMTWGVRNPVVLLPAEAEAWSLERRRDVLLHELAHIKRNDFLTQLVARVACAAYWFHPLVWLAAMRLRVERERACDDHVLRAGTKPSAYAHHLLEIARALRPVRATSLASVAMARPAQLATRLLDVLDARRCRDGISARAAAPAWAAAIAIVVPLAAIAPVVAEPEPNAPIAPPALIARPLPAMSIPTWAKRARADTLQGCAGPTRNSSSSTRVENDDLTILTTLGNCTIRVSSVGKLTFNDDFTDVGTIASGGQVVIEVDYGAHDRRVTIRRAGGGGLERVYKVDGEVRPFDAAAQAWLTETITYLLRRTGYQAEERARWILDRRGIQGLLDEFAQLHGDYTRRIYYQAAVESGKLDVAGYERLVTLAGRTISSDYELAELLISVSQTQPLSETMQAAFVTAAGSISSDYERHRVLKAALSRPGLTPAVETAILDAATAINSDYELASLLIELNEARRVDDAVRPAFFKAANTLQSDYEHRRVLTAVVGRRDATPGMLADALASAKNIRSDYELAELLIQVAEYGVDETLAPAFFAAAGTIESDYEHGRTLERLLDQRDLPRATVAAIVESSGGIQSDYQLAEVLLAVIDKVKLDDGLHSAVRSAAQGLRSSYERGRVLDALSRRSGRTELR